MFLLESQIKLFCLSTALVVLRSGGASSEKSERIQEDFDEIF